MASLAERAALVARVLQEQADINARILSLDSRPMRDGLADAYAALAVIVAELAASSPERAITTDQTP